MAASRPCAYLLRLNVSHRQQQLERGLYVTYQESGIWRPRVHCVRVVLGHSGHDVGPQCVSHGCQALAVEGRIT